MRVLLVTLVIVALLSAIVRCAVATAPSPRTGLAVAATQPRG
jgi:hypothetical protein